ncbi:MAG: bifunctional DNA-formamidopyrimidine glycosylase/DNA-(apurinic or apyrimidinic site) lyase [Syntrophales bacterium]|nr:bifunctional DNA-formamidopyrimidine glycosylase/DNA-(apurinic or apyrimidinic site) lyase [Syntrophales bacterium]
MPELPEVETVCRQLRAAIKGKRIRAARVLDEKIGKPGDTAGRIILDVERQGKWLRIRLEGGQALEFHLRMTGRFLRLEEKGVPPHARFLFSFPGENIFLVDPRRFATLSLVEGKNRRPGADALLELDAGALRKKAESRKTAIKAFMLDQKVLAGMGNIYACEALYRSGIDPRRPCRGLSPAEWKRLSRSIRFIFKEAISMRGTSISDWRDLYGRKGDFQNRLRVYGSAGAKCRRCGGEIARIVVGGRGTYYCPGCQA